MSYIKEKVSYLRGLADGLTIESEAQSKLIAAMIETLDAMADAIDENEAAIDELGESVDEIYEDMDDLEDYLFEDEDDDDDDEDDEDDDFVEVKCPNCKEIIYFDQDMLESDQDLICPNCNQPVMPAAPTDEE
jgi:ssDNA-binding Zn-finger/Zn-ribbon topoisomerase 1